MVYRTTAKTIERKQARRRKLLFAATRLFARKGFHATTVPMIVAAAGSSTGAFYLYFRNKEDIFAAVLESVGQSIAAAINEAVAQAGPGVLTHMRTAVTALVNFLAEHPGESRILIIESSGLGKRLEAVRRGVIESHTRGVRQALTAVADRLPPIEADVAASCWVGAVYEAVFRWLEQPPETRISARELADAISTFNLRGIGADPVAAGHGAITGTGEHK